MKNVTVTIKKDDIEPLLTVNKVFAGLFVLIIIYYTFNGSKPGYYFTPILGVVVSLISIYSNNKALKIKGSVVSKTTTDIDVVKRSILANRIFFVFFIILLGFIDFILLIADIDYFIGMLTISVLVLYGIHVRTKMLSKSLKRK